MTKSKKRFKAEPIEKHTAAPWANILGVKPLSNVSIPDEFNVSEAKDWVDTNEK
ncbi:protein of unknown function [Caloramator quimbayensis]|uniref:DUF3787 domain-containing protein n=1 Tax=Caloramator quimbayensis TaxID=1147123 RepID=A0A1T4WQ81_9CLOT|nr:DUF3787 domain-containing protein [Caloramator quimbayensis]SKA79476.1 protein of unknown function [Caloramator quimbayensis]